MLQILYNYIILFVAVLVCGSDIMFLRSSQASTSSLPSTGPTKFVPGLSFDSKNTGLVNGSLSLASWNNPDISQQVILKI